MTDPTPEEIEAMSAEVHTLYQRESERQRQIKRHPDDYYQLKESTKEFDRVIVRWHNEEVRAAVAAETERCAKLIEENAVNHGSPGKIKRLIPGVRPCVTRSSYAAAIRRSGEGEDAEG